MELPRISLQTSPVGSSPRPAPAAARPGAPASFGQALTEAVGKLEGLQQSADAQVQQVARGGGNLHEAAIALEKADIGLRLATRVRNRFVDAYQEIMRMNV